MMTNHQPDDPGVRPGTRKLTLTECWHYRPLSQIAKEVGSDWRHLNRLARGEVAEPKFTVGVRLLDLHLDHVPDHRSALR